MFGVAKFTSFVNELREWCYEMVDKFGKDKDKEDEDYKKWCLKKEDI